MTSPFFAFEADFVQSLRCIPMQVRLKLDLCGIKLKLAQWHQLQALDRQILVDEPCETLEQIQAYRWRLQQLVIDRTGEAATELSVDPDPAWANLTAIPEGIQTQATKAGIEITLHQWAELRQDQRFALVKLSRSHHENHNFIPALKEFNLVFDRPG